MWTQVVQPGGARPLAWEDVTARMGPVLWPRPVTRTFWKRDQLVRYLARTFPRRTPAAPAFDFAHRRLVLVAAGPRSSTGYGVVVLRVTERRADVRVLAREVTPTVAGPGRPRLTSPYRLITIPATGKHVYVQWQGR